VWRRCHACASRVHLNVCVTMCVCVSSQLCVCVCMRERERERERARERERDRRACAGVIVSVRTHTHIHTHTYTHTHLPTHTHTPVLAALDARYVLRSACAGVIASTFLEVFLYPLDTLKTRVQTRQTIKGFSFSTRKHLPRSLSLPSWHP
jgi:hypothetical protein